MNVVSLHARVKKHERGTIVMFKQSGLECSHSVGNINNIKLHRVFLQDNGIYSLPLV